MPALWQGLQSMCVSTKKIDMKSQYGFTCVAVLVLLLVLGEQGRCDALLENPQKWNVSQGDDFPLLDNQQEEAIDAAQIEASAMLAATALWIDSFFDDRRFATEENQSRATLKFSIGHSKNDSFDVKPRVDLRLKLPGLSSRVNLLVGESEDEEFFSDSEPIPGKNVQYESGKHKVAAGLQYYLKEDEEHHLSIDSGVSSQYLFTGIRYRVSRGIGDWWSSFTNRLRYYTDDGLENRASYDLDKQSSSNWLFRATTSANLLEGVRGVSHAQQFKLYNVLSAIQAVSYDFGVYFETEPLYQLVDTQFVVRYRQRFFRDWLVLEVSPRLSFPEDHDRDANPGIVITLQAALGFQAAEEGYRKIFH